MKESVPINVGIGALGIRMRLSNIYNLMIVVLAIVLGVFLSYGLFVVQITPQNQGQVSNVMTGLITVDGLLLGLTSRFREIFGKTKTGIDRANGLEALQILILSVSLIYSLVTLLVASFTTNTDMVVIWFRTSIVLFYVAVVAYSGFAIASRGYSEDKTDKAEVVRESKAMTTATPSKRNWKEVRGWITVITLIIGVGVGVFTAGEYFYPQRQPLSVPLTPLHIPQENVTYVSLSYPVIADKKIDVQAFKGVAVFLYFTAVSTAVVSAPNTSPVFFAYNLTAYGRIFQDLQPYNQAQSYLFNNAIAPGTNGFGTSYSLSISMQLNHVSSIEINAFLACYRCSVMLNSVVVNGTLFFE